MVLKGKWQGTYRYSGNRIPALLKDRETKFNIEITHVNGRQFSGIVTDDSASGGMQGVGTIRGTWNNTTLQFVKKMPIQTVYLPDGTCLMDEKSHRKIYYVGTLIEDRLTGEWKIKRGFGLFRNRFVYFPKSSGTWQMQRETVA